MKIQVIGCGNAFSKRNFNQSFLLEEDDKTLLIDCGSQIPRALDWHNIDIKSIDNIYISHLHADHIGGLEEFAFTRYDWLNKPINRDDWKIIETNDLKQPILICNEKLLEDLWNKSLCGGLESMEGFDADINTFFNTKPIRPNKLFLFSNWECKLIQQVHIMTGSIISNTFGLFLKKKDHKSIYFTTDSQHCSPKQMEVFYKEADIIFQDCELTGCSIENRNLDFASGVHANYAQLAGWENANSIRLSKEIKSKMYSSHYQDLFDINQDYKGYNVDWNELALSDGFAGFIKVGQIFDL